MEWEGLGHSFYQDLASRQFDIIFEEYRSFDLTFEDSGLPGPRNV